MAYTQWTQDFEEYRESYRPLTRETRFLSHNTFFKFPEAQYAYNASGLPVSYMAPPPSQVIQYAQPQNSIAVRGKGTNSRRRKLRRDYYDRYTTISRTMTVLRSNDPYRPFSYSVPTASTVFLTRKPRHWRKGYKSPTSKGKFGNYLGKITSIVTRSPSSFRFPYRLNPLISHHSRHSTCIFYDIRVRPSPESGLLVMGSLQPASSDDVYQLATSPPTQRLLIWHPKLPWKIEIEASAPSGISVLDIWIGIHEQLRCTIGHHEYYTVELTSEDRQMLSDVFKQRCGGDAVEMVGGLRRVDFLGQDFCFAGLSRSYNETWEMKTMTPPRQRMMID
ncbi:hypothetical protein CVT25_011372 [Psilocybe cyanescens]|uniref:DUF6699 domain-containing protein n=1 Tax=Psilocybe cyanescens TaxID=93625 RepID=A0A409WGL2_PSICY|nr:hypothetical protein CVT25_011372 [Psilocybe cyanescens]